MKLENIERETSIVSNGSEFKLSIGIIKNTLTSGNGNVTDQEAMMFLMMCKHNKLNPFLREAYLVKYGNSPAQMIVGKEAFLKKAHNSSNYQGFKAGIVVVRNNEIVYQDGTLKLSTDELIGGWAEIHTTNRIPLKHTVDLKEYNTGKNPVFREKPATMIRKVALCQALRECFPDEYQNTYGAEEMNINENELPNSPVNSNGNEKKKVINPFENNLSKTEIIEKEIPEAEIVPVAEKKEEPAQEEFEQVSLPWEDDQ